MSRHELLDGMPRDGEVEVVDEELHQVAQRHGVVGLRFFLDEVFDLIENLTDWTWPSRAWEEVVGALLEALLVLGDEGVRHSHRDGDDILGDITPSCRAEKRNHLLLPRESPEGAVHPDENSEDPLPMHVWQLLDRHQGGRP